MTNVILCGGSGTRLWPISRTLMPKQFIKLFDDKSLFQLTYERNLKLCESILVVSNAEQYFLSLDQLEEIGASGTRYLLEPVARNTAPAIALACLGVDKDEIVFATPSDHLVKNTKTYDEAVKKAENFATQGHIVVFGIKPTSANTGFGYIQSSADDVISFHEKPNEQKAKEYLTDGGYYWNSGMFMFKAGVFLNELKMHAPQIYDASLKAFKNAKKEDVIKIKFEDMANIPEDSIDYAVMEKSKNVKMVHCDMGWSDLGSFDSLYEELPKDKFGNTTNLNHICVDSSNNLIYGSDRKIATVDIEGCIIIDTKDALLICKKGSGQKIKQVVKKLEGSELASTHLTTHRPWGSYTVLENADGYKIKRIVVKPGKRLSLQKHFHRNEHWIVVCGTATVRIGDDTFLLRENESTYIKMGEIHRLSNEGKIPVVLIEAQVGKYTGEDDIVRLEDDFRRYDKS
ncbi:MULTISPECIES: mannose-1-phosphate guanylyltransferase/mannose-6-phosphate isomerase [Campylobacter]|uniref:mannose-1-phosphate guanylyltransferase/mannose-6-phosphate isomerase n=1 Tax=Campylobacter TaxID=194 RepID=UPI00027A3977|nr:MULTISPECIES: mannose-1-phosphate guanylyltransferase/mannose-6-phosphate isomerase [Campylobacter]EJP74477.1 mannose-1-phosphate guanylyltransferase/mannose-6-phosphate isomerase [Campylobacter sp. FOBRC14]